MNQPGATVQSLDRVFDIVEALSNHGNELSISQVCSITGLHKSTVHRMLASLKARGYAVQTSSGSYRLTFKFCNLSQKIINNVSVLPIVLPHLRALSMSVREIVHFVIQDNTNTVYLDRIEPPNHNYRSTVNIGMRRPLHTSAGGKIILASQGPQAWENYWEIADKTPITPYTITTFDRLESELQIFQKRQYATESEENTLGYSCVAVSLYDRYNDAHYAITLSSLKSLMTEGHIQELLPLLFDVKKQIQNDIGL
ncbi:YiaKLMNOPQRS operon repressor [uncultured Clostridium sp.]|uniref:IclR family transcriptional regulator n=1 Tax=Flintibacter sp. HCN-6482 TaxID=3134672 RepID=UPI0008210A41|nr:YiaKLMNOPQRS operon repressor [uncultured Clostridium sp.]